MLQTLKHALTTVDSAFGDSRLFCSRFFLQEILLTQFNANELDQLADNNTIASFTPATSSTSPNGGRPASGLAVFRKTSDNLFPIMFTSRVMVLKVQTMSHSFVLLNVYLCCEMHLFFQYLNSSQICRIFQTLLTLSTLMIYL